MPRTPTRVGDRLVWQRMVSRRLRDARQARGLTTREVGAATRPPHSRQWVVGIEQGRHGIDAVDLQQLADLYEYPVAFFTDRRYEMRRPHWPRTFTEWALLAGGDEARARAHWELDQQFAGDGANGP